MTGGIDLHWLPIFSYGTCILLAQRLMSYFPEFLVPGDMGNCMQLTWPLKYHTQAVSSCVDSTDCRAMMDAICRMAQASCLRPTSPYMMRAPAAPLRTRNGRSATRKHC